jgi:hypothetical protein
MLSSAARIGDALRASSSRTAHGAAMSRDPGSSTGIGVERASISVCLNCQDERLRFASLALDAGSRDAAAPHALRHDDKGWHSV